VQTLNEAKKKAKECGVDGVMIGRGIFNNFWFFNPEVDPVTIPLATRLHVMVEHLQHFEEEFGGVKNFAMMRKHIKNYVSGFSGAKELRMQLMEAGNAGEIESIVDKWIVSSL